MWEKEERKVSWSQNDTKNLGKFDSDCTVATWKHKHLGKGNVVHHIICVYKIKNFSEV